MLVWGGALSTAARWSEDCQGTCSLYVLCDSFISCSPSVSSLSLPYFSFLQDTSEFMHLTKTVPHETQVHSPHFLLYQRKSWSNVKTKSCNQVKRFNRKQEWALHYIKVKYQCSFFFPLLQFVALPFKMTVLQNKSAKTAQKNRQWVTCTLSDWLF